VITLPSCITIRLLPYLGRSKPACCMTRWRSWWFTRQSGRWVQTGWDTPVAVGPTSVYDDPDAPRQGLVFTIGVRLASSTGSRADEVGPGDAQSHRNALYCRLSLGVPVPADTVEYIEYRMKLAGAPQPAFLADALTMLHEATHGRLRDIDRVATAALKSAARRKMTQVDRDLIVEVTKADAAPEA